MTLKKIKNKKLGQATYVGDGETKEFHVPYFFADIDIGVRVNKELDIWDENYRVVVCNGNAIFNNAPPLGSTVVIWEKL